MINSSSCLCHIVCVPTLSSFQFSSVHPINHSLLRSLLALARYIPLSQVQFIEERSCEDALGLLAFDPATNQFPECISAKSASINHTKQTLVLVFLAMSMENQEYDGARSSFLSEITQVHESGFCEQGEIRVAKPDKEAGAFSLEDARILAERLVATQPSTRIKNELSASLGQVGHQLGHRFTHIG